MKFWVRKIAHKTSKNARNLAKTEHQKLQKKMKNYLCHTCTQRQKPHKRNFSGKIFRNWRSTLLTIRSSLIVHEALGQTPGGHQLQGDDSGSAAYPADAHQARNEEGVGGWDISCRENNYQRKRNTHDAHEGVKKLFGLASSPISMGCSMAPKPGW